MGNRYKILLLGLISVVMLLGACSEETAGLKQKIAELEKKLQKQEKDIRDFAESFAPPKDVSADIQRIEDQQERMAQAIKTKLDPMDGKLEEFREWAQEAQKEREAVTKKVKSAEQALAEIQKHLEADRQEVGKVGKVAAANSQKLKGVGKSLEDLSKGLTEIRKEVQENNLKLVNAVKKTLPKVRDAAVAELKDRIMPLEQTLLTLKTGIETDRKKTGTVSNQPFPDTAAESGKDQKVLKLLGARVKELEEVVAAQKAFLLEVGSKVHELEQHLRAMAGSGE